MAKTASTAHSEDRHVRVNGIDAHYVEAGKGEPLLLLHGGMLSTNPIWAGSPGAYVSRMGWFAEHFRVIAPDMRGHGKTGNPGAGPISYAQLADDAHALIGALGLDRPLIAGFSSGGTVATLVAIRHPDSVRALVNDAGYDPFNPDPQAKSFALCRQMLGGSPDATRTDPAAVERFLVGHGMADFFERMKADHDGGQGPGAWKALVTAIFDALTTCPATFEDLRKITVPTLILTGDRDMCGSVEEAVIAFRMLAKGELAILPNEGHMIPDAAVHATIAFLRKHAA